MLSIYYTANPSAVKSVPLLPILAGQKSLGETMQYITAADLFWSEGEKKMSPIINKMNLGAKNTK